MTLTVRTYIKDNRSGERVVVDFEGDDRSDRFLLLNESGGTIRLGVERAYLDWNHLIELADLIVTGSKTLKR
jgi:hypothetical protein